MRDKRVIDKHYGLFLHRGSLGGVAQSLLAEDIQDIEELGPPVGVTAPDVGQAGLPELVRPGLMTTFAADLRGMTREIAALVGTSGRVIAIEPNPFCITKLISVTRAYNNVRAVNVAASD